MPESSSKLKPWQKIFVNRSLNMARIRAIGFDMDHTLAVYQRDSFEALAFRETVRKLIDAGYPEEIEQLEFNPNYLIRGLLLDVDQGNLLKVDGFKYVKIATHGYTPLEKSERHALYNSRSFAASSFLSVDTFFALSEVQLFVDLVAYRDRNPKKVQKSYREIYIDVKRAIDLSHRDGSIKRQVLAQPELYVRRDKYLGRTLARLINGGKSLFLLTNSFWDYTSEIMDFVLPPNTDEHNHWRDYFAHVIVGAGKPGFFTDSTPFYEVMTDTSLLKIHASPLEDDKVYHAGNAKLFETLTQFAGDQILYVGDHIYGDIIRSKGVLNWRTALIVEELEDELPKLATLSSNLEAIREATDHREDVDQDLQIHRSRAIALTKQRDAAYKRGDSKKGEKIDSELAQYQERVQQLQGKLQDCDEKIRELIEERSRAVHPVWGELMKVRLDRSRFADQVVDYACIYTSRVSNLRFYSAVKRFSSPHEVLPHDL